MSALDRVMPTPRKIEVDFVDLALAPEAVEALGPDRSRLISRYRCASSDDLVTRRPHAAGVRERAERAHERARRAR